MGWLNSLLITKVVVIWLLSCVTLVTPWTLACQVPLFMGFDRQKYWSGMPFPSPGNFPDPGIKPPSPALQAVSWIALGFFTDEPPGTPLKTKPLLVHSRGLIRLVLPCEILLFMWSLPWIYSLTFTSWDILIDWFHLRIYGLDIQIYAPSTSPPCVPQINMT